MNALSSGPGFVGNYCQCHLSYWSLETAQDDSESHFPAQGGFVMTTYEWIALAGALTFLKSDDRVEREG